MESLLSLLRTHWDHEPDWHPSPCPLPARRGEGRERGGSWKASTVATAHRVHERWGETPSSPDLQWIEYFSGLDGVSPHLVHGRFSALLRLNHLRFVRLIHLGARNDNRSHTRLRCQLP